MTENSPCIPQLKQAFAEAEASEEWTLTRNEVLHLHNCNIGKEGKHPKKMLISPAESAMKLGDRYETLLMPLNIIHLYHAFQEDSGELGEMAARKMLHIIGSRPDKMTILCQLLALDLIDELGEEEEEGELTLKNVFENYDAEAIKQLIRSKLDSTKGKAHKDRLIYVRALCDALLPGDKTLPWKVFHNVFPDYPANADKSYNRILNQTFPYELKEYRTILKDVLEKFSNLNDEEINTEINGIIYRISRRYHLNRRR